MLGIGKKITEQIRLVGTSLESSARSCHTDRASFEVRLNVRVRWAVLVWNFTVYSNCTEHFSTNFFSSHSNFSETLDLKIQKIHSKYFLHAKLKTESKLGCFLKILFLFLFLSWRFLFRKRYLFFFFFSCPQYPYVSLGHQDVKYCFLQKSLVPIH